MNRSNPWVILSMAVLLAILVLASASSAAAGVGDVNFFLGQKMLKKGDWEPFENQGEFGVEVSFGKKEWPISIAADLFASTKTDTEFGVDVTGSTTELDLGVRKIWDKNKVHPYVGGGIGQISGKIEAELDGAKESVDDSAVGAWLGGGVFWRIGTRFNIGLSARWSQAKIEPVSGVEMEAGGTHLGLLLGWGWPASK